MPGEPRWAYYRPTLWAVIAGVEVDVIQAQFDYALNTVPQCVLYLPVGRNLETGAASPVHDLVDTLTEEQPVEVWCEMTEVAYSDQSVRSLGAPEGPFKVFEGDTAGPGYSRSTNGAQYVVTAVHWLGRVARGSVFSNSSYQGNPARMSYGALTPGSPTDAGGRHINVLTQATSFVTRSNVADDLWGKALYPWFESLASKDGFWVAEKPLLGSPDNKDALEAVRRLKPGGKGYVPSKPSPNLSVDVDLADEIAKDVANANPAQVAHQTLWDVLVGKFARDYHLGVVPRVSDALVVPYLAGFRGAEGKPYETVLAGEYDSCEVHMVTPRTLRGFGILAGIGSRAGGVFPTGEPDFETLGMGGWYDAKKLGMVMTEQAPGWLSNVVNTSGYVASSSGGDLKPIRTADNPAGGTTNGTVPGGKGRAKTVIKPFLDAFAKCRYAQTVLANRYMLVDGALRFDVAPGSLVSVEGVGEKFIADLDKLGQPYFGVVLRASYTLSGEAPACGTAFHVGHVRSATENASDATSVDEHPFYETAFSGTFLVDPDPASDS